MKPVSEMDTPEHHFFTGMKMIDQGRYDDAHASFARAIQLSPKFSKAFAGHALAFAYQIIYGSIQTDGYGVELCQNEG